MISRVRNELQKHIKQNMHSERKLCVKCIKIFLFKKNVFKVQKYFLRKKRIIVGITLLIVLNLQ